MRRQSQKKVHWSQTTFENLEKYVLDKVKLLIFLLSIPLLNQHLLHRKIVIFIIIGFTFADNLLLTCQDNANECDVFNGTPKFDVRGDIEASSCVRLQINDTNVLGIQDSVVQEFKNFKKIIAVGLNFTTIFEEHTSNQTWPGLKMVCMSSNKVERLQQNFFVQAKNVSLIDLSRNQIANIDTNAFAAL
jgi:Leucine-rich repeat (LRR) protein